MPAEGFGEVTIEFPSGIAPLFPGAGSDDEYVQIEGEWVYRPPQLESQGEIEADLAKARALVRKRK